MNTGEKGDVDVEDFLFFAELYLMSLHSLITQLFYLKLVSFFLDILYQSQVRSYGLMQMVRWQFFDLNRISYNIKMYSYYLVSKKYVRSVFLQRQVLARV